MNYAGGVLSHAPKVPREMIVSGRGVPPTTGSYGHAAPVLLTVKDAHGNLTGINITSNNIFKSADIQRNGYFSPQVDDGVSRGNYQFSTFDVWKDACEKPQTREDVRIPEITSHSGIIESFAPRKLDAGKGSTKLELYVHDFYAANWPNNEIGKGIHDIENLRQHLASYLGTEDGKELPTTLRESGGKPADIGNLGVGFLSKGAIYGVTRTKDGKILLTAAPDAFEKISSDAKHLGIRLYDLMDKAFAEEISHIWFRDFDKYGDSVAIETAAKENVLRHYIRLKKNAEGNPKKLDLKRRREKQIEATEHDIATTPQRYRKSGLESLVAAWEEEAAHLGVDKAEYISNKLATEAYADGQKTTKSENAKYESASSRTYEISTSNKYKSLRNAEKEGTGQAKETRQAEKAAEEKAEAPQEDAVSEAA